MKKLINKVLGILIIYISIFHFFLKVVFRIKSQRKIIVIDIDNTIADTWPSLLNSETHQNEFDRYFGLKPFLKVKEIIEINSKESKVIYLFLSARPIKFYHITNSWLINKFNFNYDFLLYLVPEAKNKVAYLSILSFFNFKITYIDDLSYNHENYMVKYYEPVLSYVKKKSNIKYIGYNEILKYQIHVK